MPQVRPVQRNSFPIRKDPDLLPVNLLVPEARPPVAPRLPLELLEGSAPRRSEQLLPRDAVEVVLGGPPVNVRKVGGFGGGEVPGPLGVVPVEAANTRGVGRGDTPAEGGLDGAGGGAVGLGGHY